MPTRLQQQLMILQQVLASQHIPQSEDDVLQMTANALTEAFGQLRILFYLIEAPPTLDPFDLIPCPARQIASNLFVFHKARHTSHFQLETDHPLCVPIEAATHTFGLLFVDRVKLPLIGAEQTIVTLMAVQTAHHLHYIDRIENLNDQSGTAASFSIIDEGCHQIRINGSTLCLKGNQWAALHLLYHHRGHTCSRQLICQRLYANDQISGNGREARLGLLIHKLRQKLGQLENNPLKIVTVRGRGYRLALKS